MSFDSTKKSLIIVLFNEKSKEEQSFSSTFLTFTRNQENVLALMTCALVPAGGSSVVVFGYFFLHCNHIKLAA